VGLIADAMFPLHAAGDVQSLSTLTSVIHALALGGGRGGGDWVDNGGGSLASRRQSSRGEQDALWEEGDDDDEGDRDDTGDGDDGWRTGRRDGDEAAGGGAVRRPRMSLPASAPAAASTAAGGGSVASTSPRSAGVGSATAPGAGLGSRASEAGAEEGGGGGDGGTGHAGFLGTPRSREHRSGDPGRRSPSPPPPPPPPHPPPSTPVAAVGASGRSGSSHTRLRTRGEQLTPLRSTPASPLPLESVRSPLGAGSAQRSSTPTSRAGAPSRLATNPARPQSAMRLGGRAPSASRLPARPPSPAHASPVVPTPPPPPTAAPTAPVLAGPDGTGAGSSAEVDRSDAGSVATAVRIRTHHVPYRNSKLTRLLQRSLGGNAKTVLIVCANPAPEDAAETLSALRFGQRAQLVRNVVSRNVVLSPDVLVRQLAKANETLAAQAAVLESLRLTLERLVGGGEGVGGGDALAAMLTALRSPAAATDRCCTCGCCSWYHLSSFDHRRTHQRRWLAHRCQRRGGSIGIST